MPGLVQFDDLNKLLSRWDRFPKKVAQVLNRLMRGGLDVIHSEVPAYPPQPPDSDYDRTGTLGRTLGVGMGGGKMGKADVETVKRSSRGYVARFGTRLDYAQHVIGSRAFHQLPQFRHWWTLPDTVAQRARPRLAKLVQGAAQILAAWITKKG
jgi:hypothetical protein